jgi:two-component system, sensor histidine kinase
MAKRKSKSSKTRSSAGSLAGKSLGQARRASSRKSRGVRAIELALAAFAHDVRTPLTGILALAELLATSELGEPERNWVATLKSTAEHLASLTTLVVDAVRADAIGLALRHEPFDPQRLAEDAAALFAARATAKGLASKAVVAPDLPTRALGDPLRLRAALENLLDNAVKFTDRGEVVLKVETTPAPGDRLRLIFSVSDRGIGMTSAEIKRLFKPFAQAGEDIAQRFGGAGLGLTLVRQLGRALGGDLTVESEPAQGSTFRLAVVVEKAPATDAADAGIDVAPLEAAGGGQSLRVLCIEDNPFGRVVMNTVLTQLGHHTDFLGTGDAAVEAVQRGGYDLVLMDVKLAGLDGLEATRRIRALSDAKGRTPIIGISGRARLADSVAARQAGMDAFLAKPVSPKTLADAIGKAIAGAMSQKAPGG